MMTYRYGLNELFVASQEFFSGLTACLFLVVFWLAVKISGGFMALFLPNFGLAAIGYGLGVYKRVGSSTLFNTICMPAFTLS